MSNDLIVIDNNLIKASYKLTVNEVRLVLVALSQMPKDVPIDHKTPYYITKSDFVKLGVDPKNVARDIRSACKDLLSRTLTIETPIGDLGTHWVHNVLHFKSEVFDKLKKDYPNSKYDEEFINALRLHNLLDSLPIIANSDDNIVARIVFHEDVIPYLSQLKSHFTQFMLSDVHGFSGTYSYRFYQWMMQFKSTGYCKVNLMDLRKMLVLENKYEATKDLRKWVIEAACDEINELSPYQVKYELIKTGRKFTHLELKFKEKKAKVKGIERDPKTIDWVNGVSDNEIKGMSQSQAIKYADKLYQNPAIVGDWSDCLKYEDAKFKLINQLQESKYVRKYMEYLLACDDPFDPKTVGFKF